MQRRTLASLITTAAVASAVTVGATQLVNGSTPSQETVFVPITPCRLIDTRPDTNIGPSSTPIGAEATVTFAAHDGSDADSTCTIPTTATALSTNVTAVGANAPSFLTLWPTGTDRPTTSNLNYGPGAPPTPNAVNLPLASNGQFDVFNRNGTIDVIIDINGYYQPSTNIGATGPQGPAGPVGPAGSDGVSEVGHRLATIDPTGINGAGGDFASVVIGTDGNPVISYFDDDDFHLKAAFCEDPTCTSPQITTLDDGGGFANDVGAYTSITIGNDGNPIISYSDISGRALKVAACTTRRCVGVTTLTVVDADGWVGSQSSIAIGTDGNPIISYFDVDNFDLKVAVCTDPACVNPATIRRLDAANESGSGTSLAIGSDGNPIIAYYDRGTDDLKVAACADTTCSTATITTVDADDDVGRQPSITIGTDGNPIISYLHATDGELRVAACTTPTCSATDITVIDDRGNAGGNSSITIGDDGNPIIASTRNSQVVVAACTDPQCSGARLTDLVVTGFSGDPAIVIGIDGRPVIAHSGQLPYGLRIAACGNPTCELYDPRTR